MPAVRRDHRRRERRRRCARIAAISLSAVAVLCGTALAAGSALGIIDLGGGVSAAPVTTVPVWNGNVGTFSSGAANGQYTYELSGIGANSVSCGPADPDVATFITSSRPLSRTDLESLIDTANPVGLNPSVDPAALGITSESGGCFPASVAGPLGTPQTQSQAAAARAMTAAITAELESQPASQPSGQPHAGPLLRELIIRRDGGRVVVVARTRRGVQVVK